MKQLLLIITLVIFHVSVFSQDERFENKVSNQITLKDDSSKLDLRVFPNPTKIQKVTLEMPLDEISDVQLISIVGKAVMQKKLKSGIHNYELDLQGIPDGVYLIQVKTPENKTVVKKLLISAD